MSTIIHFIDVGQGNMVLIQASNGENYLCDCNVTDDNQHRVLRYMADTIGWHAPISAFICTHRDADHMRGVRKVHERFPIQSIWDTGHPGTTTTSAEYTQYMRLRRDVGYVVKERLKRQDFGNTRFRYFSAMDERLDKNANAQGLVIKVEHRHNEACMYSAMLTGDCDAETWSQAIMKDYAASEVRSSILMGAHHGSITFFDDPADSKYYYTDHIQAISPTMSIISVGENPHGHPNMKAMELYDKYSSGSNNGNTVFTTQDQGTMRLTLRNDGWSLTHGL